jgi:sarcosine oxidase subunit alpha
MASIRFEGHDVPIREGDTVASALYRDGVRTFNRSLKNHRRRGLYCGTGDCPNCLVNVDGEPGIRSCVAPASDGQEVRRETGWPSTDRDVLSVTDHLHPLMPVGFYYKAFVKPRFAWAAAEKVIRRATGVGHLPLDAEVRPKPTRHTHADVVVIGAGPAGLSAAATAAEASSRVLLADEGEVADTLVGVPDEVATLAVQVRANDRID